MLNASKCVTFRNICGVNKKEKGASYFQLINVSIPIIYLAYNMTQINIKKKIRISKEKVCVKKIFERYSHV